MVMPKAPNSNYSFSLNPPLAWILILGFSFLTASLILAKLSAYLNYIFPAGALFVAVFLYSRYPILYLGFNWWLWFLVPFIARLVEYQNGWTDPELRLIILTPYLTTLLTAESFFLKPKGLILKEGLPFTLALVAVFYALFIGFAKGYAALDIGKAFLSWSTGIFFGYYLLCQWKQYPGIKSNIQNTFYWAVLLMGAYGIYQYIVAPEWDKFWLKNAEDLQLCCGWPEPYEIRVWSTLNYPFTFAYAMMACLLVLFSNLQRRFEQTLPGIYFGLFAFLLSQVRGAWVGWLIGLMSFFVKVKSGVQLRLTANIIVISTITIPLILSSPEFMEIVSRLQTLLNIKDDHSANERLEIYASLSNRALTEFIGRGLGGEAIIDAGILDVTVTLGWVGLIFFIPSIILVFTIVLSPVGAASRDYFIAAAQAIPISIFATIPFNNPFVLLPNVLFWGFLGILIAAQKYYYSSETDSQ